MSELNLPIPESYWVEPGRFLAGEYPSAAYEGRARERLDKFLESGINTFYDLTVSTNYHLIYQSYARKPANVESKSNTSAFPFWTATSRHAV